MAEQCIFCAIVNKLAPAAIVYEDEQVLAFKDNQPMAPVHVLIIPKTHYQSLNDIDDNQVEILGNLLLHAKTIAKQLNLADNGYRLMINTGKDGGQTVPHLHVHLLGGKPHLPVQVG
ncbi:MAG: histidine triad nucleotide-binding protein [Anaerolineaceae bacterium]|nr:histidine triad nucleotide-binding protein [Anaerolineaceae bacterium]